jgi:hemerythrin HHE cation binding domain-containing protein
MCNREAMPGEPGLSRSVAADDAATPFAAPVPGRARRRSAALVELSREHHQALLRAIELKRAGPETAEEAWRRFLDFWESEGKAHFEEEEQELLPAYARVADPRHPAVVRGLLEHVLIRARIAALREPGTPAAGDLNELGEWLDLHVRHEERVLFPLIEDAIGLTPA